MGTMNFLDFEPIMPTVGDLNPTAFVFHYDRNSDTLLLHLYGRPQAAMSHQMDDHIFIRVDLETHKVVGIQIEGFLKAAVYGQPALLQLAAWAGVDANEIEDIRRRISPDVQKTAAIRSVLEGNRLFAHH